MNNKIYRKVTRFLEIKKRRNRLITPNYENMINSENSITHHQLNKSLSLPRSRNDPDNNHNRYPKFYMQPQNNNNNFDGQADNDDNNHNNNLHFYSNQMIVVPRRRATSFSNLSSGSIEKQESRHKPEQIMVVDNSLKFQPILTNQNINQPQVQVQRINPQKTPLQGSIINHPNNNNNIKSEISANFSLLSPRNYNKRSNSEDIDKYRDQANKIHQSRRNINNSNSNLLNNNNNNTYSTTTNTTRINKDNICIKAAPNVPFNFQQGFSNQTQNNHNTFFLPKTEISTVQPLLTKSATPIKNNQFNTLDHLDLSSISSNNSQVLKIERKKVKTEPQAFEGTTTNSSKKSTTIPSTNKINLSKNTTKTKSNNKGKNAKTVKGRKKTLKKTSSDEDEIKLDDILPTYVKKLGLARSLSEPSVASDDYSKI